ncbi:hypothetical protein LAJ19_21150 (plasmid) [Deinococcus taeanensis]|uniref:hypothetical protein n=1 Tax=Deinococcus taeanensis TaxID=2737050 RepID=UPI001CDB96D4|nr:hypothetical protein [Deinococcus taeanensis]UBV45302.1 hypothetical protein LAJ19_21150 [Deinococcus taeanensis]
MTFQSIEHFERSRFYQSYALLRNDERTDVTGGQTFSYGFAPSMLAVEDLSLDLGPDRSHITRVSLVVAEEHPAAGLNEHQVQAVRMLVRFMAPSADVEGVVRAVASLLAAPEAGRSASVGAVQVTADRTGPLVITLECC